MTIKKLLLLLLLFASISALTACNTPLPAVQERADTISYVPIPREYVSVSCVTHGTGYIHSFYIEEPASSSRLGGREAGGTNCGGIIAAGYALPKTWFPGMKVKVRWKPNGREWVEKTTNIMRYDEVGTIYVHFFPGDQVRVVSALPYPESLKHPIPANATVPPPEEQ
ncbi:DUF3304 domain-containing protein [Herbaspirillum rhizosphaerae]|uniref:DUF3304 domain-containing protein n=1 Tax=Herbaspirillum rhizosphaerae TaxID=346179 RepID=A0ABW8Z928_9BURK